MDALGGGCYEGALMRMTPIRPDSGARLLVVNGRISDKAWPRYRPWRWFFAAALSWVDEVQVVDHRLVVALENPEAHNPEIIRQLVQAGADIQFVGELRHSLEDVYLRLMEEKR